MSARRNALPLVRLQGSTWAVLAVVLAVSLALLLTGGWGR
jgi:uncharacterized membrane protein